MAKKFLFNNKLKNRKFFRNDFFPENRDTHNPACMSLTLLPRNHSGLSTIVVTLILIVLSLVAIGIVWGFANNLIKKQISSSESCFGISDKFKINGQYTCYSYDLLTQKYSLRFSLSIGDINVDKLVIGISSASSTKGYTLTNADQTISGLSYYPSGTPIKLPDKNSGRTYFATTEFAEKIDSIRIAPVVSGTQCEVVDSISDIQDCVLIGS